MLKRYFGLCLFSIAGLGAASAQWINNGDEYWNDNANWSPATFPNGATDTANLNSPTITGPVTVSLGPAAQNIDLEILNLDGPQYTIAPGGVSTNSLNFPGILSFINITDSVGAGPHTISCPINVGTETDIDNQTTNPLTLSGKISGNLLVLGPGQFSINGTVANIQTTTGVGAAFPGELQLNTPSGINGLGTNLSIYDSSTVTLTNVNQLGSSLRVVVGEGAVLNMGGFDQETGDFVIVKSGVLNQNNALLTITGDLETVEGSISGPCMLSGIVSSVITTPGDNTAVFSGPINLGGLSRFFTVTDGAASPDLLVSGVISNGGVIKVDAGMLTLTGANTYSGLTVVSGGTLQGNTTSLPGDISLANNSTLIFNQMTDGTYASVISGLGVLNKQGTGVLTLSNANSPVNVIVSQGTLSINDGLLTSSLLVSPGATLRGIGEIISSNTTISGALSPGNSIGTIHIIGPVTFTSGSTFAVEISPTAADLAIITGSLTIDPGSTLVATLLPGNYTSTFSYTVLQASGGITGTFSGITTSTPPLPLLSLSFDVTSSDVTITGGFAPFTSLFHKGNAGQAAKALTSLNNVSCGNLSSIIETLRFIPTVSGLKKALLQLQPSAFTSLGIAQENDVLYIKNTIYNRLEKQVHCCPPRKSQKDEAKEPEAGYFKRNYSDRFQSRCQNNNTLNLWVSALGAHTSQRSFNGEPGFIANSPGAFMGFDARMGEQSCVGFGFGYTHTHLNWRQRRGKANLQTGYGALYGQWRAPSGFIQSSITGGYNVYSIRRHIAFGDTAPVRATAKSSHTGGEGSFHLKSGLDLKVRRTSFLPFLGLDYIFIHENSFRERGAQSLNLKIKDKNSDLLSTEVGIDITQCFRDNNHSYTPFVRLSAIEEMRFRGKREKAVFECGGSTMLVKGLNPYRTLGAAAIGFSALLFKDNDLSAFYQGKWGRKYSDSSFYLQYLRRF